MSFLGKDEALFGGAQFPEVIIIPIALMEKPESEFTLHADVNVVFHLIRHLAVKASAALEFHRGHRDEALRRWGQIIMYEGEDFALAAQFSLIPLAPRAASVADLLAGILKLSA